MPWNCTGCCDRGGGIDTIGQSADAVHFRGARNLARVALAERAVASDFSESVAHGGVNYARYTDAILDRIVNAAIVSGCGAVAVHTKERQRRDVQIGTCQIEHVERADRAIRCCVELAANGDRAASSSF